jgi:hypothetical protein
MATDQSPMAAIRRMRLAARFVLVSAALNLTGDLLADQVDPVKLADLQSDTLIQGNLFADDPSAKQQQLLAVIAAIEARFGKGAIYFAATGGVAPVWAMHQEHLSPRYLTRWTDLPIAHA